MKLINNGIKYKIINSCDKRGTLALSENKKKIK